MADFPGTNTTNYAVTNDGTPTITLPAGATYTAATTGQLFTTDGNEWRIVGDDAVQPVAVVDTVGVPFEVRPYPGEGLREPAETLAEWVDGHIRYWYDQGIFDKPVLYVPSRKAKEAYLASTNRRQHVPVVEVILTNFVTLKIGNNPTLRYINE